MQTDTTSIESDLDKLAIRPSLGVPGKTVRLMKIMNVNESAHPGYEVQEALVFSRTKQFNTRDLIATQEEVDVDKVKQLLKVTKLDYIKVIEKNNKSYIIDGHHRFLVSYLRKMTKLKCLVIKFNT